jgi:hypothetical protein
MEKFHSIQAQYRWSDVSIKIIYCYRIYSIIFRRHFIYVWSDNETALNDKLGIVIVVLLKKYCSHEEIAHHQTLRKEIYQIKTT